MKNKFPSYFQNTGSVLNTIHRSDHRVMGKQSLRLSKLFLFSAVLGLVFATGAALPASAASTDCSLGYWKNHEDVWPAPYIPDTDYLDVFDQSTLDPDVTLLQALKLKGGGENALARQSVAALLDAARNDGFSLDVNYVTQITNAAYNGGDIENTKNELENAIILCVPD